MALGLSVDATTAIDGAAPNAALDTAVDAAAEIDAAAATTPSCSNYSVYLPGVEILGVGVDGDEVAAITAQTTEYYYWTDPLTTANVNWAVYKSGSKLGHGQLGPVAPSTNFMPKANDLTYPVWRWPGDGAWRAAFPSRKEPESTGRPWRLCKAACSTCEPTCVTHMLPALPAKQPGKPAWYEVASWQSDSAVVIATQAAANLKAIWGAAFSVWRLHDDGSKEEIDLSCAVAKAKEIGLGQYMHSVRVDESGFWVPFSAINTGKFESKTTSVTLVHVVGAAGACVSDKQFVITGFPEISHASFAQTFGGAHLVGGCPVGLSTDGVDFWFGKVDGPGKAVRYDSFHAGACWRMRAGPNPGLLFFHAIQAGNPISPPNWPFPGYEGWLERLTLFNAATAKVVWDTVVKHKDARVSTKAVDGAGHVAIGIALKPPFFSKGSFDSVLVAAGPAGPGSCIVPATACLNVSETCTSTPLCQLTWCSDVVCQSEVVNDGTACYVGSCVGGACVPSAAKLEIQAL